MHAYHCFGLKIASDIPLPELLAGDASGSADVTVALGEQLGDSLPGGTQLGPFVWNATDALLLRVPGVARFRVERGTHIRVEPEPGSDDDSIRTFLLGSAFGAMLLQRGKLVLHGNAIEIGSGCIVCVGESGIGKSTLAAGFQRRGFRLLSDDVVALDDDFRVLPGFPRVKLWRDMLDHFAIDPATLRRTRPTLDKYDMPLRDHFAPDPLPLRQIFELQDGHVAETSFERLEGMAAFQALKANTYRERFLDGTTLRPRHLALSGTLAHRVPLWRITRPRRGFTLDPLIDRILDTVTQDA